MCYNNLDMCSLIIDVGNYTPPRFIAFQPKLGTQPQRRPIFKKEVSQHNTTVVDQLKNEKQPWMESGNIWRMSSDVFGNSDCNISLWNGFNMPFKYQFYNGGRILVLKRIEKLKMGLMFPIYQSL